MSRGRQRCCLREGESMNRESVWGAQPLIAQRSKGRPDAATQWFVVALFRGAL